LYNNQNVDKTATMLRLTNRLISTVYWQPTNTSNFRLDYRKTWSAYFQITGGKKDFLKFLV